MFARSLLLAAAVVAPARGEVKLHPLFGDHMVLPRDAAVPVWGTAASGEAVSVATTAAPGVTAAATADADGNWSVTLPKLNAGTGHTLTVKGTNEVTFKNVAVGDVWLCSGQSNMEGRLRNLTADDQGKRVAAAATHPNIRLFHVPNRPAGTPQADFPVDAKAGQGLWLECTPDTAWHFSAVGYFFGRELQPAINVPVGLVALDLGGSRAEAWTSRPALLAAPELAYLVAKFDEATRTYDPARAKADHDKAVAEFEREVAQAKAEGRPPARTRPAVFQKPPPEMPTTTTLFNGMVAPIVRFPVTGAAWYQGESNAPRAAEYRTLLPTMVRDWRARWGYDFPFLIVQITPYKGGQGPAGVDWAELRDAQANAAAILGRAALVATTDVGDETDIHPQRKEPIGRRLALAARRVAYGEDVEASGPTFKDCTVEGDTVVVTFDHVGGGLVANGEGPTGFQVCGADREFRPAKAEIKGDTVVVRGDAVTRPVAVRYGWANFPKPELNLFNGQGLPAVPFRTDDFPLTTAAEK